MLQLQIPRPLHILQRTFTSPHSNFFLFDWTGLDGSRIGVHRPTGPAYFSNKVTVIHKLLVNTIFLSDRHTKA